MKVLSLLAVVASVLLTACDNGPSPTTSTPLRAGADKSAPVTRTLPSAAERQYEPAVVPENEEKGLKIGETVAGTGGQQAQKEKDRKAQAAADAETRTQ